MAYHNHLRPPRLRMDNTPRPDDDSQGDDDDDDEQEQEHSFPPNPSHYLFPPAANSAHSSTSSTPVPSRSTSPLPQFYPQPSSCPSESDSEEPSSPLLREHPITHMWWRKQPRRPWWSASRRREERGWRPARLARRWLRRLVRHPFFPSQPITIVSLYLSLFLFSFMSLYLF